MQSFICAMALSRLVKRPVATKRGYECRHTTDEAHAVNPKDSRRFVPDESGNLWETDAEQGV